MNDTFYINPVYGFRTWKLDCNQGGLVSLTGRGGWPAGKPLLSRHHGRSGEASSTCAPGEPCQSCGIYAFEHYGQVQDHQWVSGRIDLDVVRGIVAGWGQVTLCTGGWRAGKAYPLAMLDWQAPPEDYGFDGVQWHIMMNLVARRYGVPVVPSVNDLVEVAKDAGAVPLSEWREEEQTDAA